MSKKNLLKIKYFVVSLVVLACFACAKSNENTEKQNSSPLPPAQQNPSPTTTQTNTESGTKQSESSFDLSFDNKIIVNTDHSLTLNATYFGEDRTIDSIERHIFCEINNKKNSTIIKIQPEDSGSKNLTNKQILLLSFNIDQKISDEKIDITIFDISKITCQFDKGNVFKKIHSEWNKITVSVSLSLGDFGFSGGELVSKRYLNAYIFFKGEGQFTTTSNDMIQCLGWYQNKTWIELLPTENRSIMFTNNTTETLSLDLDNAYIGSTKVNKTNLSKIKCTLRKITGLTDTSSNNNNISNDALVW